MPSKRPLILHPSTVIHHHAAPFVLAVIPAHSLPGPRPGAGIRARMGPSGITTETAKSTEKGWRQGTCARTALGERIEPMWHCKI